MSSLLCLATIIYFEARSEPVQAQAYVAETVITRASAEGSSICKSMRSKGSYSFKKGQAMLDKKAKATAILVAHKALRSKLKRFTYFNEKHLGKRFKTSQKPITISKLMFY